MSQVRKFKDGGSNTAETTSKSKHNSKYGHYIVDGTTYDVNDDFIRNYIASAKQFNDNSTNTVASHIVNALKSGQDVSLDTLNNRIYGINDYLNSEDVERSNEYSQNSSNKKYQRKYRRKEARPNSSLHQLNIGISNLGSIQFTEPIPESNKETSVKPSLFGSYNWFDYNDNEDGTKYYSTAPINATNERILDQYADLYNLTPEQAREKYDLDENKYNQFLDWKNKFGAQFMGENNDGFTQLLNRIKNQQVTQEDEDLLSLLGFTYSKPTPTSTTTSRSYEGSGFNNDALERAGYYILKDANGNPVLYDNNRQVVRNKIYLRDFDWANNSPYAGGAWYNGRFYTQDQLWNQDNDASRDFQQNYVNAAMAEDAEGNRTWEAYTNALKNSGWMYAGMNDDSRFTLQDPTKSLLPGFEYLKNPYYFQDISQNYNAPENTSIIQFFDMNNRDRDGRPIMRYAVSDNDQLFNSINELQTYLSGLSTPITRVQGIKTPRQTFQPDISRDKDGNEYVNSKAILAHVIQKDGSLLDAEIYHGKNGAYYFKGQNGNFYQIYGRNLMNRIINGDPITEREFERGRDEADKRPLAGNILNWTWLGASDDVARKTDWYNYGEYDNVLGFKKGGKINKFQFGGEFAYTPVNITKGAKSDDKIGTMHKIGGGPGLTDASDKWANAATALDTASLGASFIPGYGNIVGGFTGIGGSAARFVSDIKRDGFDGGDIGRLALNLGLDALTFIPFIGSAAKATKMGKAAKGLTKAGKNIDKVAEAAKKTEDLISKSDVLGNIPNFGKLFKPGEKAKKVGRALEIALPAVGTINGIGAAINAASDGEITSNELSSIATGVMSGALLGRGISRAIDRSALRAIQKKLNISAPEQSFSATFKNKDGKDITVILKGDDLSSLKGKRKKELIKTLETKVTNAGGNLEKTGIKAEDLIDRFKIPMKDGMISGINKNWNKTNIPKDKKLDVYDTEALSNQKLAETLQNPNLGYWTNRAARAYRYGLSHNADALSSIQKSTGKTITWNPAWTFGGKQSSWLDIPSANTPSQTPKQILALPAWNSSTGNINSIQSQGPIITSQPKIAGLLPQYASSHRNAQGQFLLPRGDGRFFKKTQRVWNGGPAHEVIQLQPAKYSRTPRKSTRRNIGLEQAHKQRVLQEAGRQQMPVIRGLQEDIAKVRTSEDFKNLLFKINNRGSYKEIIKNNPEIKDQLRQMFIHLDPVRLGNWMTKYDLRFKKGGKIIKGQNGLKPGDLVYNNTSSPSYFDYNRSGIKFNGSNVDWTATYNPNSLYSKYRNIYLNNWDNPEFNVYKQAYLNQLSQGNSNINVNNLSKDEFARITNDNLLGYAHNLYVDPNGDNGLYNLAMNQLPAATVTAKSNIKPIPQGKAVAQSSLGLIPNPALSNSNQAVKETKQSTQKSSGAGSQYTNANSVLKNFNFNPDDLFGLIETTRSIIANNQLYKDLKEANTAVLKPYMPEIYDRYQDHITPIYQEAAKAKRNFIPTSTDSTVNYAMRQANEDTAQQLETEGRLKASEQYSQYLDKDLAARRAYAEDRRNTAFYNTQEMANKVMRDAQIEQGRKLANNQSISNYVMEMRNKFAQDRAKSQAFQKQQDTLLAQQALNAEVNKAAQKWRTIFANMDPEERKAKGYDSYEDIWLEQDPKSYNNAYITGQLKAQQYLQDNQNKYIDYWFNKVPYVNLLANYKTPVSMPAYMSSFKSGGKTRKYTQRHTGQKPDEAIWIQRNKDTAKALEKLHDAVIKLFMKSIS